MKTRNRSFSMTGHGEAASPLVPPLARAPVHIVERKMHESALRRGDIDFIQCFTDHRQSPMPPGVPFSSISICDNRLRCERPLSIFFTFHLLSSPRNRGSRFGARKKKDEKLYIYLYVPAIVGLLSRKMCCSVIPGKTRLWFACNKCTREVLESRRCCDKQSL